MPADLTKPGLGGHGDRHRRVVHARIGAVAQIADELRQCDQGRGVIHITRPRRNARQRGRHGANQVAVHRRRHNHDPGQIIWQLRWSALVGVGVKTFSVDPAFIVRADPREVRPKDLGHAFDIAGGTLGRVVGERFRPALAMQREDVEKTFAPAVAYLLRVTQRMR